MTLETPIRAGVAPGRFVAAVSGKGGVGKTNLVANLAVAAAGMGARALVLDGDLGLANVDVLLGLVPSRSVADLLEERCGIEEVLMRGPRGFDLLPAASGRRDLAALGPASLERLWAAVRSVADRYDLVLVDAGAGVGPSVVGLAVRCDPVLVVATPEPTSLADAYAALKVIRQTAPARRFELFVNAARHETEARRVHEHLARVSRRFLGAELGFRGFAPFDDHLADAVARQRAVVEMYPSSPSARGIAALAASLLREARGRYTPCPTATRSPGSGPPSDPTSRTT